MFKGWYENGLIQHYERHKHLQPYGPLKNNWLRQIYKLPRYDFYYIGDSDFEYKPEFLSTLQGLYHALIRKDIKVGIMSAFHHPNDAERFGNKTGEVKGLNKTIKYYLTETTAGGSMFFDREVFEAMFKQRSKDIGVAFQFKTPMETVQNRINGWDEFLTRSIFKLGYQNIGLWNSMVQHGLDPKRSGVQGLNYE